MAANSKKTTTYKRKQRSATVTITPEVTATTLEPTTTPVQMLPIENTVTMPAIDLEADQKTIEAPASGVEVSLRVGGAVSSTVEFVATPSSTDAPINVTGAYSELGTFSGTEFDLEAACVEAFDASPAPVEGGKGYYSTAEGWVGPQDLTVTCTAKGGDYSADTTAYTIKGTVPSFNGTAEVTPVDPATYNVKVAPLPTNDPHFVVDEHGNPQLVGAWTYSATSEFATLTPAPSYTGYSSNVGTLTVHDANSDQTVTVAVKQTIPANAGTVSPLHVAAENTVTLTPVSIRPAIGAEKKAYHVADYENWTVQPNCSWIHMHLPKYSSGTLVHNEVGETVGSGTISKAVIYDDSQWISAVDHPAEAAEQQANQLVRIIMKTDANATGKARVAYPTVKVGRKTYKITVNQNA